MNESMLKALVIVFSVMGIIMAGLAVFLFLTKDAESDSPIYYLLFASAIIDFGFAIYLNRKNKKNK